MEPFSEPSSTFGYPTTEEKPTPKNHITSKEVLKHTGLFLLTFVSVAYSGMLFVGFANESSTLWSDFSRGMIFSGLLLGFLTVHEFGHYFAAVYHQIRVTLPYYIPLPLIGIGTLGAVIRIKEVIKSTKQLFDVGASGPLAGFVASLAILIYGFATLPEPEFINQFGGHDDTIAYVQQNGVFPAEPLEIPETGVLIAGKTLLYVFLESFFENTPPMWEMYHYPFLFAGWLGLFFTALNLMPVGQLDGGHILYTLLGPKNHRKAAGIFFLVLATLGGQGAIPFIHIYLAEWDTSFALLSWGIWASFLFLLLNKAFSGNLPWRNWGFALSLLGTAILIYGFQLHSTDGIVWVVWTVFIAYFVKIEHPPVFINKPLDPTRKALGWLCMLIFILCISPAPFRVLTP